MTVSYDKFGLKEVINASGKMTILGVSTVSDSVLAAQKFGGTHFFEMADLQKKTGKYLADLLKVGGAYIVSSASAGIAQTIAGLIGQGEMYHLYHPYTNKITRREIIIPKGHNVDYGAPFELMIAQGGGKMIEAGYANECSAEQIEWMITPETAAIIYVKSHHTVQKSMLTVEDAVEVAHQHNLPLIVDAASEEDLTKYYQMGADVVIYSGSKAISGPTAGLVTGKKKYIDWISMQSKGLGRSMKIGKENILGFTQAVEDYLHTKGETGEEMKQRLTPFVEALNQINGIEAKIVGDSAGRDIYRASVKFSTKKNAQIIALELRAKSPAVYTREYQANNGILEFDVRAVTNEQLEAIVTRLSEIINEK